jgi:transcription elongation GreA/GreB family factor
MSRAFVKESDAVDELPDRVISEHPNYVTAKGLELIERMVADLSTRLADAQRQGDRSALSATSRELRYWDSRRASAILVPPSTDTATVRFGSIVTIKRDDGRRQSFRIVGEDEADPSEGTLSHASPLARSLLGKTQGDVASVGQGEAKIVKVET